MNKPKRQRNSILKSISLKECIDRISNDNRLYIIDFIPIYVEYHFAPRRIGSLLYVRFRFERFVYPMNTPCLSEIDLKKKLYIYDTNTLSCIPPLDKEKLIKGLTNHLFGYFKNDNISRKIFPLFRHFLTMENVIDISTIYRFLPKRTFSTFLFDNPYLRSQYKLSSNDQIKTKELSLELSNGWFSDDLMPPERARNYNLILDHIPLGFLKELRIYPCNDNRRIKVSSFDLMKDLHVNRFKDSLEVIKLESTSLSQFLEALHYFPNLRSIKGTFEVEKKKNEDVELSSNTELCYPKIRKVEIGGSLLNDVTIEVILSRLFPHLNHLTLFNLKTSKVSSKGFIKSFTNISSQHLRILRMIDCEFKELSSEDEDPIKPQENLENVLFHINTELRTSHLDFLSTIAPNLIRLDLLSFNKSHEGYISTNFPRLKALRTRKDMKEVLSQDFDASSDPTLDQLLPPGVDRMIKRKRSTNVWECLEELDVFVTDPYQFSSVISSTFENQMKSVTVRVRLLDPKELFRLSFKVGYFIGALFKVEQQEQEEKESSSMKLSKNKNLREVRLFFSDGMYYSQHSEKVVREMKRGVVGVYTESLKESIKMCNDSSMLSSNALERIEIGVCDNEDDVEEFSAPVFIWDRKMGFIVE